MPSTGIFNESIFLSNLGDFLSFTELGPPDKIIPDRFLFTKNLNQFYYKDALNNKHFALLSSVQSIAYTVNRNQQLKLFRYLTFLI